MAVGRHPAVTAKMFATLDTLSGGRIICGVGIGWMQDEFEFLGIPFAERAAMSDEYVAVIKALWTDDHPRVAGKYVTLDRDVLDFRHLPVVLLRHKKLASWFTCGVLLRFHCNSV